MKGRMPTTQNCGKSKKINGCQERRARTQDFRACEKTLYDMIIVNTSFIHM